MSINALLIDTDVLSYITWKRQRASAFQPLIEGKSLAVSFVTVGEMYYGAMKARWGDDRMADMDSKLRQYITIHSTYDIARHYGSVKKAFADQVGENDMWIAATALTYRMPVVTNNLRHFKPIADRFNLLLVHPDFGCHG